MLLSKQRQLLRHAGHQPCALASVRERLPEVERGAV
jgi:hypothetical protein